MYKAEFEAQFKNIGVKISLIVLKMLLYRQALLLTWI